MAATTPDNTGSIGKFDKPELQMIVAMAFLAILAGAIVYVIVVSHVDIKMTGSLDVNQFMTLFFGIIIGIFTWLGFKSGIASQN